MNKNKFRAFYKGDKNTSDGYLRFDQKEIDDSLYFVHEDKEKFPNDELRYAFEIPFLDDDWILLKFTGQKDVNETDIYEGDLIEWGMSHDQIKAFPRLRFVEFNEKQLIYKVVEVGDLPSSVDYLYEAAPKSTRWCKVVGNIYENPELLNS